MRANPPYLGFDGICRRFEIIISATERILAAAQTIIPETERSLFATERILAVASIIICRMEKTVWLTDFIPDARGIMSAKPSRITGETEIIIGEASLNPSGLEMIETIAGFIDSVLCAVAFMTRLLGTPCSMPNGIEHCACYSTVSGERVLRKLSRLGDLSRFRDRCYKLSKKYLAK